MKSPDVGPGGVLDEGGRDPNLYNECILSVSRSAPNLRWRECEQTLILKKL